MISFIVLAHNEEFEHSSTLVAIHAAASSAAQPYEIIVVDDASTDATPEIAAQGAAQVFRTNPPQLAAPRHAAARPAPRPSPPFPPPHPPPPPAPPRAPPPPPPPP